MQSTLVRNNFFNYLETKKTPMEKPLDQIPFVDPNENLEVAQMNLDESTEDVRKAAYWFFGIAALSVVNIFLASKGSFFIMGLGMNQIVDAIVIELTGDVNYMISLAIPLIFVFIGFFAAKCNRWAFIAGGIIYLLDAVLFLYFEFWLAFAFHAFILYKLWKGYKTISEYDEFRSKLGR
jgi:hypothetical protein